MNHDPINAVEGDPRLDRSLSSVVSAFETLEAVKTKLHRIFVNFKRAGYQQEVLSGVQDVALAI